MKSSKATYGPMTIDLVQLCGIKILKVIHRCAVLCFRNNVLPEELREEKLKLLLKSKGVIDFINDYRGIFLRNSILSVYQKWLYMKKCFNSG